MTDWFNRNARWLAVPGLFVAFLFAVAILNEWYTIGVEANPATIESYYFGSEPMVGYGGEHYRSAEAYASSSLTVGLVALGVAAVFAFGLVRRSGAAVAVGYAVIVGYLVMGLVV